MEAYPASINASAQLAALWWHSLMSSARGLPNDVVLAHLLAGQRAGLGCLPPDLGLGTQAMRHLLQRHFPGATWPLPAGVTTPPADAEVEDIRHLLRAQGAGKDDSEHWLAQIVSAACLGKDHLWQDLGLPSREVLSQLMRDNFPALTAKNVHDMKWKKFLYKQLCEQEGIRTCRAPSCEYCTDYLNCFGEED